MPVPRQDSMGREPETLIDKIEKRLENSRYNIQMVDEKDTKLLRVWSLALIGLLLGLTVYQTILAAFTGSIIGDTIAGPTIYIVATGIFFVCLYMLGTLGAYGYYGRILGVYGVLAMISSIAAMFGFGWAVVRGRSYDDFIDQCEHYLYGLALKNETDYSWVKYFSDLGGSRALVEDCPVVRVHPAFVGAALLRISP
mmetsp:Transcript_9346/g.34288  ORF Transcript_9346/g.34288 Transcript_9346/m.34288 type:complete len:197 (-) Transcript_9346:1439-2029(-)